MNAKSLDTSKCLNFVFKDQTPTFCFSNFFCNFFLTQCERHKKQEQGCDKNKNANNRTQDANKNETRCKQERK